MDKAHAVVILPWRWANVRVALTPQNRRWLAQSRLLPGTAAEPLFQVLGALGVSVPEQGLGALRLWGQTGRWPDRWVAAADPVFLEARLDHLGLHVLPDLPEEELSGIVECLRSVLPEDDVKFISVRELGYITGRQPVPAPSAASLPTSLPTPVATASASPRSAQGESPQSFMPTGEGAAAHDRLQSEMQMCLFDAEVNKRRANKGEPPVSTLWLWGGGIAPQPNERDDAYLPALYADDPLCRGYWFSKGATAADWPGSVAGCQDAAPAGFVAVMPHNRQFAPETEINAELAGLRGMLRRRGLRSMSIIFADGSRVDRRRRDGLRFWRRKLPTPLQKDSR